MLILAIYLEKNYLAWNSNISAALLLSFCLSFLPLPSLLFWDG